MSEQPNDPWISVKDRLPTAKITCLCKIERPAEDEPDGVRRFESKKIFYPSASGGVWFGGCRPFADHDVVTHWQEPPKESGN